MGMHCLGIARALADSGAPNAIRGRVGYVTFAKYTGQTQSRSGRPSRRSSKTCSEHHLDVPQRRWFTFTALAVIPTPDYTVYPPWSYTGVSITIRHPYDSPPLGAFLIRR